jgi:hypothetical protein
MSTIIIEEGSEWLQRAGLGTMIEPWEDGLREQPRPGSLEWWYFDAHLEDGSSLVAVFMTKPTSSSAGEISPCVLAQLTLPNGEIIDALQPFPASQFRASRDGCDVHIGPNWLRGDLHRYEFSLDTPALSMQLTFTGTLPSARIGTGETHLGEKDTFGWLVAVPRAVVTGTITLRGQTRSVSGLGYHDHNWGSLPFEDFLQEWYWGRAYLGDYTLIFAEIHSRPAYGETRIPQLLLGRNEQLLLATGHSAQFQVEKERQEGTVIVPEVATFIWSQGTDQVSLTLDQTRLITNVKQGPMSMLRFLADARLQIHIGDLHDEIRGQVLYEHPTFFKE